ncbi:MAG: DUF4399 domain-containing protein [Gammaproteobacteria bacterium]|nr:DUF4399 domain-containing protein [Gammaproteobacteria bacterium]
MRQSLPAAILIVSSLGLAACGSEPPPAAPAEPANAAPVAAAPAALPRTPAPAGVSVSIVSPADGAHVSSPVTVQFAIEGMSLAPAGTHEPGTGHHHLLVDVDPPAGDQPIPTDANHLHFGKAQTEATVELGPGTHRLQLLLGDGNHVPHEPPVLSAPVTITVE